MPDGIGLLVRSSREDGFTLIELLITIVLLGIISAALGSAFSSFLTNTDTTSRRLSESHDVQTSAAYFAQDVASLGDRDSSGVLLQSVETAATAQLLSCGVAGDASPIVGFSWDDPTSATASSQVRVVYLIRTVGAERQLHRLVCGGTATTPSSDIVLVHNLATTAPTVTCATPALCGGSGASVPQSVTLALSIKNPANPGPAVSITLAGQRRQT